MIAKNIKDFTKTETKAFREKKQDLFFKTLIQV